MNKNTLIGFLLIGLVLIAYSYFTRPNPEEIAALNRYNDSIAAVNAQQQLDAQIANVQQLQSDTAHLEVLPDSLKETHLQNQYGDFFLAAKGEETFVTLENELLEVIISSKGGRVYSARLKQFTDKNDQILTLFDEDESGFGVTLITSNNRIVNTKDFYFESIVENNKVTMRLNAGNLGSLDYIYTLEPDDYMLRFEVISKGLERVLLPNTNSLDILWQQKARQQEAGRSFESRFARLNYKYTADGNVEQLSESREVSQRVDNKVRWIAFKNQFFSSVLIANDSFEDTKLTSKPFEEGRFIKDYSASVTVPFDVTGKETTLFHYYFGPNDYKLLRQYDRNRFKEQNLYLEKLVPLGWGLFRLVNKWIVIPVFNFWVALCGSIGIAIFLLTLTIKTILFPLSYKSFMSSAKMRVMRPQVEIITEKYPGQENAMVRQQKTMELYRQVGVNPMSGCLPMLLQMPFLFALFMFFPAAIQLRHESFLWASDLSTYDAILSWDTYIPLVTPYFGNHISLFCLLMVITQLISTKYNMDQTNTGQQQMPGMKAMMYIMPLFMLVFLNQYPSGLNYYYFVSTLITVLQMVAFRYFVNEEKILAQLEANKKKPAKKKSGFMARLEEAQRQQQALAKQKAKTGKR